VQLKFFFTKKGREGGKKKDDLPPHKKIHLSLLSPKGKKEKGRGGGE